MNKQAHFSEDRKHRFWLLRSWEESPKMISFIGLNPSTADDIDDDPTIRSCIRLTKQQGYGGFVMLNLFTFITASPKVLIENMHDANRIESNHFLIKMVANTHKAICAWGSWKFIDSRVKTVLELIDDPYCFGINQDGNPKHPLYLNTNTELIPYKR